MSERLEITITTRYMKYPSLNVAIRAFSPDEELRERAELYAIRRDFVTRFTREKIKRLKVEEYIEGDGGKNSFCYILERKLDGLGRITNSPINKFGVYFSHGKLQHTDRYGNTNEIAFQNVKKHIVSLLDAGAKEDVNALAENIISPMFKGKILATYYPDRYLNVFSGDHLRHFMRLFGLDSTGADMRNEVYMRGALVDFKNNHSIMKDWDLDIFGRFLYLYYDPRWLKPGQLVSPIELDDKHFSYVDLDIDCERIPTEKEFSGKAGNTDYDKQARRLKALGDKGEEIVMEAEVLRLVEELHYTKAKAEKSVVRISKIDDSYGYDIKSLNADGSTRYIEVKATTKKGLSADFFYTRNEYKTAKKYKENYYVYFVFEVTSSQPKIWRIPNPFLSGKTLMTPVLYKVCIPAKSGK